MSQRIAIVVALAIVPTASAAERPVEPAGYVPRASGVEGRPTPMRRVLYLNFDGGDIEWCGEGEDDPHGNCSTIFQGAVAPYSGDATARIAVVQTVVQDLQDFDVVVTTERPAEDIDYDMEMIGQWSPLAGGGFLGIAPKIDCFDGDGGDLSFTLDPADLSPPDTAKVVLQELAHTWGLEHVDSTGDLLFPTVGNAPDPKFEDQCSPIVYSPTQCPDQHALFCETPGDQNSHAEMLMLFGPRQPDTVAPTLTILSPADGAQLLGDFHLVIELHDDVAPQQFATTVEFVGGFSSDVDLAGPGVFPIALTDVPDGAWTVRVTASDPEGNASMQEIAVQVGEPAAPDTSGSDTSNDTSTSAGDHDHDHGADDETTSGAQQSDDGGCNCAAGAPVSAMWPWLSIALLAPLRRRRA